MRISFDKPEDFGVKSIDTSKEETVITGMCYGGVDILFHLNGTTKKYSFKTYKNKTSEVKISIFGEKVYLIEMPTLDNIYNSIVFTFTPNVRAVNNEEVVNFEY